MSKTIRTRLAAGLTTGAAAAFALTLAAGAATAAGSATEWTHDDKGVAGKWTFTMEVSDPTPRVGDEIVIRNSMKHSEIIRTMNKVKQVVPQCLEYVGASGSKKLGKVEDNTGAEDSNVVIYSPGTAWTIDNKPFTFDVNYKVTKACATGEPLNAVLHVSGGPQVGEVNFDNHPVSFTVSKSSGIVDGGSSSGSLDTGSLNAFLP